MSGSISSNLLCKYFKVIEQGCRDLQDFHWLEENLDCHPELAYMRLPNGELPLRMLLKQKAPPGLFVLLTQHGAEHDIITASAATDVPEIQRLLHREPQLVHETDDEGNTALHWACVQEGYSKQPCDTIGLVNLLLASGADVNARNTLGHTPLDRHILDGDCEACKTLLEHGATPNVLYGVVVEDFEVLDYLLCQTPDQIHWRDPRDGRCLLHLAVQWECHTMMFEYMFARGAKADIEAHFGRAAWTPLLLAIQSDNSEAAEVLIRHGADVNAREHRVNSRVWNKSAIQLAVTHDRVGLAEMLIARGADIHELGSQGETLLCRAESTEMAELLIRAGIDLATRDHHGRSPLDYAIEEGRRHVATIVARHEAAPTFFYHVAVGDCEKVHGMLDNDPRLIAAYNQPVGNSSAPTLDEDSIEVPWGSIGGTALHYAVKAGVLGMVELLLDRGAKVNAPTEPQKWTPLHDATYYTIMRDLRERAAIIEALVLAGADLNARTWGAIAP